MTRFCWITGIILLASGLCFGAAEKLIVSNYPEEISEPGVLVSTPLGGKLTRLMYYHIGRAESEYEINTVLENQTGVPVTLKVRSAPGGPSRDGIYAGHRSAVGFWNAKLKNQSSRVTIPPYQHVTVFSQPLRPQMVSTAVLDFETESDGEIQLKVGVVDPEFPLISLLNVPPEPYLFGEFPTISKRVEMTYRFETPVREIPIGDEPFLFDPKNGILLRGNYGMVYDLVVLAHNPFPFRRRLNLLFAPAGGIARGALLINGKIIETGFIDHKSNLAPETVYSTDIPSGGSTTLRISTFPQGGCFYPINMVLSSPSPDDSTP